MSLFESDVEFFSDVLDEQAELRESLGNDEDFKDFVARHGLLEALYRVSSFHKHIAQQISDYDKLQVRGRVEWRGRVGGLCSLLKKRRQQLRKAVVSAFGEQDVKLISTRVSNEVS